MFIQKIKLLLLALLIVAGTSIGAPAQTYMQLDEALRSASSPLKARPKGISTVAKYRFGPYQITKGRESWTTTRTTTGLFSGDTQLESRTRISFVFTGPPGPDTLTANITLTQATEIEEQHGFFFRTLTGWSNPQLSQSYELYLAEFTTTSPEPWYLMLAYPLGGEITGEVSEEMISRFRGVLSNQRTSIEIVPELRWDNGRVSSLFRPLEGYVFRRNGEALAAVQTSPPHKTFVWIKESLSPDLRFVLAGAAASLLVRSARE